MTSQPYLERVTDYLDKLCRENPNRRTGSQGNRAATDFFAARMASFGFEVVCQTFECIDWTWDGAELSANGRNFEVYPSPYTRGYQVAAPLRVVDSVEALAKAEVAGQIVLLCGEIAKEPLMPKNFPFYNPDEHQRIISLLEAKHPLAILTASPRNPEMAGGVYPLPMLEDGDFDFPSAYMSEEEGSRLVQLAGQTIPLEIRASRQLATGCNVIARKGESQEQRVVLCAHIDAKEGTPGAIDNASGVATLLLLAEMLEDYPGKLGIELAAINGEDYYTNPGEQLYLRCNEGRFENILLAINLDGVGYIQGNTAYSLYDVPAWLDGAIREVFSGYPGLLPGEPWYQGDHSLFLMQGRPALALTSERVSELMASIVHTSEDRPEIVKAARLVELAVALHTLLLRLDHLAPTL